MLKGVNGHLRKMQNFEIEWIFADSFHGIAEQTWGDFKHNPRCFTRHSILGMAPPTSHWEKQERSKELRQQHLLWTLSPQLIAFLRIFLKLLLLFLTHEIISASPALTASNFPPVAPVHPWDAKNILLLLSQKMHPVPAHVQSSLCMLNSFIMGIKLQGKWDLVEERLSQPPGGPGHLKETELSVSQSSEAAFAVITDKLIKLLLKVMETAYL